MFPALRRGVSSRWSRSTTTALPTWIHDTVGRHQDLTTCSASRLASTASAPSARSPSTPASAPGSSAARSTCGPPSTSPSPWSSPATSTRPRSAPTRRRCGSRAPRPRSCCGPSSRRTRACTTRSRQNDTVDASGDGEAVAGRRGLRDVRRSRPTDPENPLDVTAAENVFYLWNLVYLNGVVHGDVDENLDGTTVHRRRPRRTAWITSASTTTAAPPSTGAGGAGDPAALSPLTTLQPADHRAWSDYARRHLRHDRAGAPSGGCRSSSPRPAPPIRNDDWPDARAGWSRYATWIARATPRRRRRARLLLLDAHGQLRVEPRHGHPHGALRRVEGRPRRRRARPAAASRPTPRIAATGTISTGAAATVPGALAKTEHRFRPGLPRWCGRPILALRTGSPLIYH
ncbi:MAG: hypothetical protein MZV70_17195 [Desulfobacterales bacterium]|nr:hypothetical protein [Desulfobacterales bacterium]